MHTSLKVLSLAGLVIVSFGAGAITAAIFHLGSPLVTVRLENESQQEVASVRLEHEHGSLVISHLEPGGSRIVRFYAPGESSYELSLVFVDGRTLKSGNYVEAGYRVTEVITESEIKSSYELLGYGITVTPYSLP